MYEIVLVNLVNLQEYIFYNITQLHLLGYNITVIITDNLLEHFSNINTIKIILTSELEDYGYDTQSRLDNTFRNGFWKLTSHRLFYLHSYMKKYTVHNIIHIENDVLLYDDVHIPDPSKMWITMDSKNRCIPGIMFIPSHTIFDGLIQTYDTEKTDMDNMAYFYNTNSTTCMTFPIIAKNSKYPDTTYLNHTFEMFGCIFDAAAIGQYLGGVDPRNIGNDTRGFVNETCEIDYSLYEFVWKYDNVRSIYQPYIIIDTECIKVVNMHIHSKRLSAFLSTNPLETKLIPYRIENMISKSEIITGERIQNIACIYLGVHEDFAYNPAISTQTSKHVNIESIDSEYNNPNIVFCYTHRLSHLQSKIHLFKNPFVLITHNSDENVDNKYHTLVYSDKVIQWYAQNVMVEYPKLSILPIGIANSMWPHGDINCIQSINYFTKTKNFYFYFNITTNTREREMCRHEIEKKGLEFGSPISEYGIYLKDLSSYKFAICPPGNGIDCHRMWECFYLGVIPVMLKSVFSEKISKLLPCIILDRWGDFDPTIVFEYSNLLKRLQNSLRYLQFTHYYSSMLLPKDIQ